MTDSTDNQRPLVHGLVSFLTIMLCLGGMRGFLPELVQFKLAEKQIEAAEAEETLAQDKKAVSQELLSYVEKQRETALSESESLVLEDEKQTFKIEPIDYTASADDVLSSRFKTKSETDLSAEELFSVPEGLEDIVEFWVHVFGHYTRDHTVFYNYENVGIVYSVLDFSELAQLNVNGRGALKGRIVAEEKRRIKALLKKLAPRFKGESLSTRDLTDDEITVAQQLWDARDHLDLSEKGLLRSMRQRKGFSHRIRQAIVDSGSYMPEMQRIFSERGLPPELTMIPFIESAFNLKAYSRAGAAGIWQFIEATGRRYLRIDEFVDERYDPILAAYAAASHLLHEFEFLGSWPLTINAYNTGPGRMLKARNRFGHDIAKIVKHFKGAGYGSDSRNYFPEFLAALYVYNNQDEFFGELPVKPLQKFKYMALPSPVNLKQFASLSGVALHKLQSFNLGLKPEVATGNKVLPKGYLLKVPASQTDNALVALKQLHQEFEAMTHHVVQEGESLRRIARRYDISTKELAQANNLMPRSRVKEGDVLRLPRGDDFELAQELEVSEDRVVPDDVNPVL